MPGFVSGDFSFVLQREADVIQPFQKAMTGNFVDAELRRKTSAILDRAVFEINGQLIVGSLGRTAGDFATVLLTQNNSQHAILHAVAGKDVGERGCDDRAKSIIR